MDTYTHLWSTAELLAEVHEWHDDRRVHPECRLCNPVDPEDEAAIRAQDDDPGIDMLAAAGA